ncbi:MAG: hypothetical protein SV062_14905, partial [Thermodesulfobacteriota bacterium]|nr:hypothetical protein [Thermodesulfobacteriota bacterium]
MFSQQNYSPQIDRMKKPQADSSSLFGRLKDIYENYLQLRNKDIPFQEEIEINSIFKFLFKWVASLFSHYKIFLIYTFTSGGDFLVLKFYQINFEQLFPLQLKFKSRISSLKFYSLLKNLKTEKEENFYTSEEIDKTLKIFTDNINAGPIQHTVPFIRLLNTCIFFPLTILGNKKGYLTILSTRSPHKNEVKGLNWFGETISTIIGRESFRQLEAEKNRMEGILVKLGSVISGDMSREKILLRLLEVIKEQINYDVGIAGLLDKNGEAKSVEVKGMKKETIKDRFYNEIAPKFLHSSKLIDEGEILIELSGTKYQNFILFPLSLNEQELVILSFGKNRFDGDYKNKLEMLKSMLPHVGSVINKLFSYVEEVKKKDVTLDFLSKKIK